MKILLVENHQNFAKAVIAEFLSEHQVDLVSSIAAAKEHLKTNSYDVIMSDYDLDDGKGDELVSYLRSIGCDIPVVAISSHDRGNQAIMTAGGTDICCKMKFRGINQVLRKLQV